MSKAGNIHLNSNYEIDDLSDYIKLFTKEIEPDDYYFRGEREYHENMDASAFRKVKNTTYYFNYESILHDFYGEIASSITDIERNNFIPFAQHYGLRTQLLDVSSNQAVALYFATKESQGNKEDDTCYVYGFKKSRSIDISSLILDNWEKDIFSDIRNKNSNVWIILDREMQRIYTDEINYFNYLFLDLGYHCSEVAPVLKFYKSSSPGSSTRFCK